VVDFAVGFTLGGLVVLVPFSFSRCAAVRNITSLPLLYRLQSPSGLV
jgi:hypothetical protein